LERISKEKSCIIGGIVKHSNGVGFKLTFNNAELANKYKDMFRWILVADGVEVVYKLGYYDEYKENGDKK